jgi:dTDP-4-dehydrorhamnose reductase
MLRLGTERDEVEVVDDQRGCPTYVGHLAEAVRELVDGDRARGLWHVAADGDCTWADFAEAIFEEAGVECQVRRISSSELVRPAARPAYSVLRSQRPGAPQLAHWREGLRACLERLQRDG